MADIALVADGDDVLASQQNVIANALNGPWSSWTPAIVGSVASPVLGSGSTAAGRYKQIASGLVIAVGRFVIGSSPSNGSGDYQFSLPVLGDLTDNWGIGTCTFRDSGTQTYVGQCQMFNTSKFRVLIHGNGSTAFGGSSGPIATLASGDSIQFNIAYEPA